MKQFAHKNVAQGSSISVSVSKFVDSPKVIEMAFGFSQNLKRRQQIAHSECTQKKTDTRQEYKTKQNTTLITQEEENECQNCAKWKKWSQSQQKMLLQLQKQMIIKEEKLQEVMKRYRSQIVEKSQKSQNLQLALQQKLTQVSSLEKTLAAVSKQLEQIENQQKILETPKKQYIKQAAIELPIDETKFQPIHIKGMQSTDKINNPTKDSAFTTRAEGWQCSETMKKKHVQKVLHFGRRSQLQKYVFQNQTLKDYNAVLVERLKASKYKGVIC